MEEVKQEAVKQDTLDEQATDKPVLTNKQIVRIIPNMVKILKKVDMAKYIRENQVKAEENKVTDLEKNLYGYEMALYVLEKVDKYEKELFTVVAIVHDKPVEEVESGSFIETYETFEAILTNEELMNFFTRLTK